jgi:hypothetical protein
MRITCASSSAAVSASFSFLDCSVSLKVYTRIEQLPLTSSASFHALKISSAVGEVSK